MGSIQRADCSPPSWTERASTTMFQSLNTRPMADSYKTKPSSLDIGAHYLLQLYWRLGEGAHLRRTRGCSGCG